MTRIGASGGMSSWPRSTNNREYKACMEETAADIRARRERGEPVGSTEHVTGEVQEPGYRRKQQNARLVERAMRFGVLPAELAKLEMPSNVGFLRAERPPWWRRLAGRLFRPG
jgi:hypothetical protein